MNIVDFANYVSMSCNTEYPDAKYIDWDDPAGHNDFSTKKGGFTNNAKLINEAIGATLQPSEQNLSARLNAVDGQLTRIDGMLIDPRCVRILNGFMGGYCYKEVGNTGTYQDKPDKNRFSHVHDALQYVVVRLTKSQGSATPFRPRRNIRAPKR